MLTWLWRWWRGRLTHWRVVMYTRQRCPLCDDAWALLKRERRRYGFALEAVDVDTDAELAERYGMMVPVVVVNGKERFRGKVSAPLLRRLLRAEGQSPASGGR